ncbi:E3 ubiquitin-protein ligase rififylin-like [Arapaima gigas]
MSWLLVPVQPTDSLTVSRVGGTIHSLSLWPYTGMWTSCCSWFCVDTTGTTVEDTAAHRVYMSSGRGQPPAASDVLCKACGGCFGTSARKHICVDCKKNFCSRCFVQLELRPRLCLTCQRFHRTLFDRAELMRLKVKDLLDYLHLHEVPTQACREKEELVELVLGQRTPSSSSSSSEGVAQQGAPPQQAAPPSHVELRPRSPEENQVHVFISGCFTWHQNCLKHLGSGWRSGKSCHLGLNPVSDCSTLQQSTYPELKE